MHLNFDLIYILLVIPAVFGSIGQSCEIVGGDYGVCLSEMDCTPVRCEGKRRCINENYNVTPFGICPDGDGICCSKTVKIFNDITLPKPGHCFNKVNCNVKENLRLRTRVCPGKDDVLCIPNEVLKTIKYKDLITMRKQKKTFMGKIFGKLKEMGIYI